MKPPTETFDIGRGYRVEFRFDGQRIDVDWLPDLPSAEVGRELLPAYRAARNQFLARLVPAYGSVAVIER
jgi:hypothetical protein